MPINLIFPLQQGPTGYFAYNTTVENATRENLKNLIFTPRGTRPNLTSYGTNIEKMIMEPRTPQTKNLVRRDISDAVNQWIKNININSIQALYSEDLAGTQWSNVVLEMWSMLVVLTYTIVSSDGLITIPNQTVGAVLNGKA